jgi:hypothetical protein
MPYLPITRRRDGGSFNVVTALLLLVAIGVGYVAYVYLPPWMRNRRVQQAMKEASYQAWRSDDDALRKIVLDRTGRLWPEAAASNGRLPEIRGGMIDIERDREARTAAIALSYEVEVELPLLDQRRTVRFDNRVETSTAPPSEEKQSEFLQWLTH